VLTEADPTIVICRICQDRLDSLSSQLVADRLIEFRPPYSAKQCDWSTVRKAAAWRAVTQILIAKYDRCRWERSKGYISLNSCLKMWFLRQTDKKPYSCVVVLESVVFSEMPA
jgi:hypothetical protein